MKHIALALAVLLSLTVTASAAGARLEVRTPKGPAEAGAVFQVEVGISGNEGFRSLQFSLSYDTDELECTEVKAGDLIQDALWAGNPAAPGGAAFAVAASGVIEGDGLAAVFTFRAKTGLEEIAVRPVEAQMSDGDSSLFVPAADVIPTADLPLAKPSAEMPTDGQSQTTAGQAGQSQTTDGQAGQSQSTGGQAGQSQTADGQAGQSQTTAGQAGQSQTTDGQSGQSQTADGQAGQSQTTDGQAGQSQTADGQAGQSQTADEQAVQSQTAAGQAGQSQTTGGQAGQSQTADGQAGQSQTTGGQAGRETAQSGGAGTEPSSPFTDTAGIWAEHDIAEAARRGLFHGYPDGSFRPNNVITRGQYVLVLWNLAGRPAPEKTPPFRDLDSLSAEFRDAVTWAWEQGYVNGTAPDRFSPGSWLTRQAAMKILYGFNGGTVGAAALLTGSYDSIYQDSGKLSAWAKEGVYWAVYHNIMRGVTNNTLNPAGVLTRAQLAAVMIRYTDRFPAASET